MNPLAYSMVTRPSIGSPPRDNSSGVFDGRAAAAGEGGGVFYSSAHNGDVVDRIARELRRGGIGVGGGGGGDIKITKGDDGSVNLHLGRR